MAWTTTEHDRRILRDLARRHAELAADPVMAERRRLWQAHNSLHGERPMVLIEVGSIQDAFIAELPLECTEGWARSLERGFRLAAFQTEEVGDDSVLSGYLTCNWQVNLGDYGVHHRTEHGTDHRGGHLGYRWEHPIKDLGRELERLQPRRFSVDRPGTLAWQEHLATVFDGILPVHRRGGYFWTTGLTLPAVLLIGLENLMLYMVDQPVALHRLMAFLRDDTLAMLDWLEREELLSLNNDNDYIGSGSRGFCTELPQPDWRAGQPVRWRDCWALAESQETVAISPGMFEEFVFEYQQPIMERFGLIYWGCCEPVHHRWHCLSRVGNLRSVSISPWCDQALAAEQLQRQYVYSRKPSPALISTGRWDEGQIQADLEQTLTAARGCEVELVMKDVHTVNDEPWRLRRWVELARQVGEAAG